MCQWNLSHLIFFPFPQSLHHWKNTFLCMLSYETNSNQHAYTRHSIETINISHLALSCCVQPPSTVYTKKKMNRFCASSPVCTRYAKIFAFHFYCFWFFCFIPFACSCTRCLALVCVCALFSVVISGEHFYGKTIEINCLLCMCYLCASVCALKLLFGSIGWFCTLCTNICVCNAVVVVVAAVHTFSFPYTLHLHWYPHWT